VRRKETTAMGRYSVRIGVTLDQMLGELAEAAWQTAKPAVNAKNADKLRGDLTRALRDVIRRDMIWSDICGLAVVCTDSTASEPWTAGDEGATKSSMLVNEEAYNTARCGERD